MNSPGPSSWRIFLSLARLGLLRWGRRLLGRLRPLRRRADLPVKRQATPRKGAWSPALAVLLVLPFLLIVVNNSSQLVWRLGRELARGAAADQMGISADLYTHLAAREQDLARARSRPASHSAPSSQPSTAPQNLRARRQQVLEKLQEEVNLEFYSSPGPPRRRRE